MKVVSVTSDNQWYNLYTLSEIPSGSILITNGTSRYLELLQSATQPAPLDKGWPVNVDATALAHDNGLPIWVKATISGPVLVQELANTITPFTGVDLPHDVYTWDQEGFRRLRVDSGQTSFFTGRQFRTFKELSIPAGNTYIIRVVVGVDTVLWNVNLTVDAGSIKLSTFSGGTPAVAMDDPIPVIPKNTMSTRPTPFYTSMNTLVGEATTLTGGTQIDVARVVTSGATAQQITVGQSNFGERGVGVGTYYWVFNNFASGTATGVFSAFWEER